MDARPRLINGDEMPCRVNTATCGAFGSRGSASIEVGISVLFLVVLSIATLAQVGSNSKAILGSIMTDQYVRPVLGTDGGGDPCVFSPAQCKPPPPGSPTGR